VHPDKPSWIIVNDFGKRIVEFLNGRNSVFDLVRILKPYYYVDKHTLEKDIKEFIGLLYTSGIADENQKHIKIEDQFYSNIFIHITANCNLRCKH
jgi:hypothetical protein